MTIPHAFASITAATILLGTACSQGASSDQAELTAGGAAAASSGQDANQRTSTRLGGAQDSQPAQLDSDVESSDDVTTESAQQTSEDRRGLTPLDFPHEIEVSATASVVPNCARRGDTITLAVKTKPDAALAYHAVYQGNEGGSVPPYGEGHGGNDKGQASAQGRWENSWVVGPRAPFGRARVDVVIGWKGKWGYEHPFFHVVPSLKDCP